MSTEKFTIMQDPCNPLNWGIVWEDSGTQGGFTSKDAARVDALSQGGFEITSDEASTWEW